MSGLRQRKVLLVGWDGADWNIARPLMESGQMPVLSALVERGASGDIASYAPYLSPMLWTTIATGKWPDKHGVHGFAEVVGDRVLPVSSHARQVKAFWNLLSSQEISCGTVGWFASHPAEPIKGVTVSDAFIHPPAGSEWPVAEGSVFPPEYGTRLADLRVRPQDLDSGLLGLFIPKVAEIDLTRDARPRRLMARLAELYTVHNIAVSLAAEVQCLAVYYHFPDWVSHDFMAYHRPQMAGVSARDFELYRDVLNGAYRLQDLLLGDLLREAGPETTVILVSDHGFLSGADRPEHTPRVAAGIAAWHRPTGMVVAAGPGIKAGKLIQGARLEDITPTLLSLYGLPAGKDMEGRVLSAVLEDPVPARVPTWEAPAGTPPPQRTAALPGQDLLLQQFIALGYLVEPSSRTGIHAEETARQNAWNLGIALLELDRPGDALEHLERCYLEEPESAQYAYHAARCRLHLGLLPEAYGALATLEDLGQDQPLAVLLRAKILLAEQKPRQAWQILNDAQVLSGRWQSERNRLRWRAVLTEGRYAEVESQILDFSKGTPRAQADLLLLAYAQFCLKKFAQAVETATRATAAKGRSPVGLTLLGQALERTGRLEKAREIYSALLEIEPNARFAQQRLAALSERPPRLLPARIEPENLWESVAARVHARQGFREESRARLQAALERKAGARQSNTPVNSLAINAGRKKAGEYLIVSGVPRSGTSLMMRMLAMGGVPVLSDGVRAADEDNPLGYFEWESIKRLPGEPELIELAEGKAVKVISALLESLPANRRYRVIFMRRPSAETARSQAVMLARSATAPGLPAADLAEKLDCHVAEVLARLKAAAHIQLLEVPFGGLIAEPAQWIARVVEFVGGERVKRPESMARAIRAELYRQRQP